MIAIFEWAFLWGYVLVWTSTQKPRELRIETHGKKNKKPARLLQRNVGGGFVSEPLMLIAV